MFTVYNNGSVQFRSTSDNLYNLRNVDKLAESRNKPDDELYHTIENGGKDNKEQKYNKKSIEAYKKIANIDTNEEIYHVKDIMTTKCISINVQSTLLEAYELLKKEKISQIPIVTDTNKIVNIINKKTILNFIMDDLDNGKFTVYKHFNTLNLADCVTADPISDIRRVAQVMIEHKIDAIPVVNKENVLVGIVSKTDIIKAVSYIPDLRLWA